MLDAWFNVTMSVLDTLLGWMLYLPSDAILAVLALLTAGLMVVTRPWATNQDMLARVDQDRARLKVLMRAAKQAKDKEALLRYRATSNRLALRKLAAEGKPLLVAIVPVALLATWAMYRVEFHPPAENEEIKVVALLESDTSPGEIIHMVPQAEPELLRATNGWVQIVGKRPNDPSLLDRFLVWTNLTEPSTPPPDKLAAWTLKGKARAEPYELKIRFRDLAIKERKLLIGQKTYEPSVVVDDDGQVTTQIEMRPVRLFGIVPGLGDYLPAWIVGYIIIVVPLVFVLKWALKIY